MGAKAEEEKKPSKSVLIVAEGVREGKPITNTFWLGKVEEVIGGLGGECLICSK